MAAPAPAVLKDVVAYVEVWSSNGTENYSKTFTNQLVEMGAKVSKTFNKQVTHVVFKDGYQSTWDKARKRGTKLVSVLWVEKCRTAGVHADEALFPATNPSEHTVSLMRKRRKCMQPKDFIPKTPENDKRLQRKFEKMTEELQRQKTTLDDSMPVFLFESHGSLTSSSSVKISHHQAMEQRLQEMKEKREQLSPTSSQRTEQAHRSPGDSLCEASLDISRDTVCADESFAGGLYSSLGDLCGRSGCGNQDRKLGDSVKEIKSDTCSSSPVLKTSNIHPLASSSCLSELSPQKCASDLPKAEVGRLRDLGGETVTPDRRQAQGVSDLHEVKSSPPATSAARGHLWLHSVPGSSSAKGKRTSVDLCSPPRSTLKRRRSGQRPVGPWEQQLRSSRSLRFPTSAVMGTPDCGVSSYEDYFSPENLQERTSAGHPPVSRPSPGPAHFSCRSLSKRERASILEMSDLSCIGEKSTLVSITDLTAKTTSSLQSPACLAAEDTPAAEESPGCRGRAGSPQGDDAGPTGSHHPHNTHDPAGPGQESSCSPVQGRRAERELVGGRGTQKEGPEAAVPNSPGRHTQKEFELHFGGDPHEEQSAEEEKENLALGYSGYVKNGPARHDVSYSSQEGVQDLVRPHEESEKSRKSKKWDRRGGLSWLLRVVLQRKFSAGLGASVLLSCAEDGFSLAPEVCETTTHVLAGKPLRTLNVLLGIGRGCWVLSYEWVCRLQRLSSPGQYRGTLFADQPTMFISLASSPPRAKLCELVCRLQRLSSPGQYRGTLFADQPTMFISLASSPPRAKLCELVLLCGGHISPGPRHASIFIGPYSGRRRATVQHLSEKWVLARDPERRPWFCFQKARIRRTAAGQSCASTAVRGGAVRLIEGSSRAGSRRAEALESGLSVQLLCVSPALRGFVPLLLERRQQRREATLPVPVPRVVSGEALSPVRMAKAAPAAGSSSASPCAHPTQENPFQPQAWGPMALNQPGLLKAMACGWQGQQQCRKSWSPATPSRTGCPGRSALASHQCSLEPTFPKQCCAPAKNLSSCQPANRWDSELSPASSPGPQQAKSGKGPCVVNRVPAGSEHRTASVCSRCKPVLMITRSLVPGSTCSGSDRIGSRDSVMQHRVCAFESYLLRGSAVASTPGSEPGKEALAQDDCGHSSA
ncbi:Microcephalin [Heterocephalus glaber]|uniref:Microcephalin n=1 Tax=Heterocephalus glaber TaxID=10181 RepID=G5BC96_HETGA|nr:Microcephalin [Heterocephalus glaber]